MSYSFKSVVSFLKIFLILLYCFSMLFWTFGKTLLTAVLIGFGTLSCFNCILRLDCSVSSLSRKIRSFLGVLGLFLHDVQAFLELFGYLAVVLVFLRSIVLIASPESNVLIMKSAFVSL